MKRLRVCIGSKDMKKYTCPCCGHMVFNSPPGSFEICPICFWEDDIVQLRYVNVRGANKVSLIDGQKNYIDFGACMRDLVDYVRKPNKKDIIDPEWRIFSIDSDIIEEYSQNEKPRLDDTTKYYYWK